MFLYLLNLLGLVKTSDGEPESKDSGESTIIIVVAVLAAIALLIWILNNR